MQKVTLTIGNFDGVHKGHQQLFRHMASLPGRAVAVSFRNHPRTVLNPHAHVPFLSRPEQREAWIRACHIDTVHWLDFSPLLRDLSAEEFLDYLGYPIAHLVLGYDAVFGKGRVGNRQHLEMLGKERGFEVHSLEASTYQGRPISTSWVKEAVAEGNLELAQSLLGRPYILQGPVMRGLGKGKHLGFPTANIDCAGYAMPPFGVYEVSVSRGAATYKGIANIGLAPTIKNSSTPQVEVHLFDFADNLYGETLSFSLQRFIRKEQRFESLDALKAQIAADITSCAGRVPRSLHSA